ncbi:MAG: ferredoxin reductase family protein [Acidimicrobiales bacterium]
MLDSDLAWAVGCYVAVVIGMWSMHGGLSHLSEGVTGVATAVTQLTGLGASAVGLIGLLLTARPVFLERRYGLDRLFVWHRILGETMAVLVGVHVAAAVFEWQVGGDWAGAIADLTGRQPYFAGATIGALLIGVVTVTSLRSVRNRLAYETWYLMHLTAYLGFALSFGHQIVTGADLSDDAIARWVWIGLHVAVALALLWGRWGRVVRSVARPLRVSAIEPVAPGIVTVRLTGRRLRSMRGSAGQFCFLRALTRDGWWRSNPFSLSEAPGHDGLRFTIKDRGDASSLLGSLSVGDRVAVDGPYGVCTPEVTEGRKVVFVVGGVGIAPARALLEVLPRSAEPIVLYRAHSERELVHHDELVRLANARNGRVMTLVGPSATLAVKDPFGADTLRRAVPDIAERVAVLCGPDRLLSAARAGLTKAGLAPGDLHYEHSWW